MRLSITILILYLCTANKLIAQVITSPPPAQNKTESLNALKEVIIKGGTSSQKEAREIRESPFAVSVLEGKRFANKATSIEQIINQIPGIRIRNEGGLGSTSQLNIHGLEGRRVSFFIDGNPIYSPSGSFNITDIPVQVIKRIEVYKGIVPAKYGADGLGGAINIETLDIYDRDYVDITYQFGSFNTHRSTVILKKWFEKPGILVGISGFFNYSDNSYMMDVPEQSIRVRREHDKYISTVPSMNIKFKKWYFDEIELEANYYINKKEIQGLQKDTRYAYNKSNIIIAGLKLEKDDFLFKNLDLSFQARLPVLKSELIDTSHYIWDYKGNVYYSAIGGEINNIPHDLVNQQKGLLQRLNLDYSINERNNINFNNNIRYSNQTTRDNPAFKLTGYNTVGYPGTIFSNITGLAWQYANKQNNLQNQLLLKIYQLNSKITDTKRKSIRDTPPVNSNNELHIGYGDGVTWAFMPSVRAKLSYEYTYRLPDSEELFGDGILIAPASKLIAENSDNLNAGVLFDKDNAMGLSHVQWDVSAFYMSVKNMIRLLSDGMNFGYANVDKVRVAGIETEFKVDITADWYAHINFTYQDLRDVAELVAGTNIENPTKDLRLPNTPWLYGNFGLEYHRYGWFGHPQNYSRIYLESSYTGSYYYNWKISALQDQSIPEVFSNNIGLEQSFSKGRYIVGAEVNNITDERIYNQYNMPLPGRSINIKFRYVFTPQNKQN